MSMSRWAGMLEHLLAVPLTQFAFFSSKFTHLLSRNLMVPNGSIGSSGLRAPTRTWMMSLRITGGMIQKAFEYSCPQTTCNGNDRLPHPKRLNFESTGSGAANNQGPPIHIQAAIIATAKHFITAFNQNDAASLATYFTQNGSILPAYGDPVTGKGAIQAFWQAAFDMGIRTAERKTIEVEGTDDFAFEVGSYVLRGVDGDVLDRGKYLVVWKQEDGQWRYHRDIWNGYLPFRAAPFSRLPPP
jgi:uncharacterized protein (TIGR02246 family)